MWLMMVSAAILLIPAVRNDCGYTVTWKQTIAELKIVHKRSFLLYPNMVNKGSCKSDRVCIETWGVGVGGVGDISGGEERLIIYQA